MDEPEICSCPVSVFSPSSYHLFFQSLAISLRSANMSSRPPHIALLKRSGSHVHQKSRSSRKSVDSSAHPMNSHYHDLRQLEPEEDLIELSSRPPTPQRHTERSEVPESWSGGSAFESDHRLKTYHAKQYVTQQNTPLLIRAFDGTPVMVVFKHRQVFSTLKIPLYTESLLSELLVMLVATKAGRASNHVIYCIQPLLPCGRRILH